MRAYRLVVEETDPDVVLSYDARALGLVIERYAELTSVAKGGGKGVRSKGLRMQLGRDSSDSRVVSVVTYTKAWAAKAARQQTSENLETHELTNLAGRFSLDLLRALVCHQTHKLTAYSFAQGIERVLGEETELVVPDVLRGAPTARVARHCASQARLLHRLNRKLKTLEETVEMARVTGLPLRTIANQAQMVRTENLLLKAARSQGYVLPLSAGLSAVPASLRWTSSEMVSDTRAYNHWPWPWAELEADQQFAVNCGVAGHCSRTALGSDGSAGLHEEPVAVLDFASLYPSVFISHNICYSTLLPPKAHGAIGLTHHRTPNTVGPNTRVPGAVGVDDRRSWPGDAIAFVGSEEHAGLLPRLLSALLQQRRSVKARVKQLRAATETSTEASANAYLAEVLDARQLTLKLLANASYGFTGADTSHLCCKPLAEACLRFGNYWTRTASELIEAEGAAHDGTSPRFPGAAVIYANTDSVFVLLPGRTPKQAVEEGKAMAEYVTSHSRLPAGLTLEFERVLSPCLLDRHNQYAGAEYVRGDETRPTLHHKGIVERRMCKYVADVVLGALELLLLDGSREAAIDYCARSGRELLAGEVASHLLCEGGFLKRADQRDLLRMAGMGKEGKVDRATREADETLRKENTVSLAIDLLKRSSTTDGLPTIVFRQGEYVPFVAARRSGGATGSKQFENLASPEEVVMRATPVDLRLLYEKRLLPALIGQVKEASGKATKEAAEQDKPVLIGRIMSSKARQELRFGAHSRRSYSGVLTIDNGWKLYGMSEAPKEPASARKGGQGKIQSFFGGPPKGGGGNGGGAATGGGNAGGGAGPSEELASTALPGSNPPTPAKDESMGSADEEVARWEQEVTRLEAARKRVSMESGGQEGAPMLLYNHAPALANALRLLDAARRKRARLGNFTPPAKA